MCDFFADLKLSSLSPPQVDTEPGSQGNSPWEASPSAPKAPPTHTSKDFRPLVISGLASSETSDLAGPFSESFLICGETGKTRGWGMPS